MGGALNLVFQLQHSDEEESANPTSKTGPKELGKLDIKWRTTLGDVGRLQTLPISAPAAAMRDISLQVVGSALMKPGLLSLLLCLGGSNAPAVYALCIGHLFPSMTRVICCGKQTLNQVQIQRCAFWHLGLSS